MRWRRGAAVAAVLWWMAAVAASADPRPADLRDSTPRRVQIWFESSPRNQPGRLASDFKGPFPAFIAPAHDAAFVQLRVPGRVVERHLLGGAVPVRGSFSDFEWLIERETGRVVSATLTGEVQEPVKLGLATLHMRTRLSVAMASDRAAGYRPGAQTFGREVFHFCDPSDATSGEPCHAVAGVPYSPTSGYLNAVGHIRADAGLFSLATFSPLGEARILEDESEVTTAALNASPSAVSAAPPPAQR
jgi:hypothetical protein